MHTGWITGVADRLAFPARMVLTVSFVLSPGSDALLPPSPQRIADARPVGPPHHRWDLTHRPRASGPHDFSVRGRFCRSSGARVCSPRMTNPTAVTAPCRTASRETHGFSPCLARCAPALPRPPQARPASR